MGARGEFPYGLRVGAGRHPYGHREADRVEPSALRVEAGARLVLVRQDLHTRARRLAEERQQLAGGGGRQEQLLRVEQFGIAAERRVGAQGEALRGGRGEGGVGAGVAADSGGGGALPLEEGEVGVGCGPRRHGATVGRGRFGAYRRMPGLSSDVCPAP
ncbi:putative OsmC family protein [Streptomyces sp. Tu6071]|nr:putative OsmC family protein [Streptomyces sp. Tu6071]